MNSSNDDTPKPKVVVGSDPRPAPRKWRWQRPSKRTVIIIAAVLVLLITTFVVYRVTRPQVKVATSVATVEITETGFSPGVIKIKKGERIVWVNKDSKLHQVAADPHPTSESLPSLKSDEPLLQDEVYSAVFEKSGTFTYHDYLDPLNLQGTIIVE